LIRQPNKRPAYTPSTRTTQIEVGSFDIGDVACSSLTEPEPDEHWRQE
jgi:hypothetical protein